MYSFSIRQFIWEYIGGFIFFWKVPLCIRFQLGNSFGNTCVFFGKFLLCNRFHLGNSFGNTYVFFWGGGNSLMYSFSIRQFIWEYIGDFIFFGKFPYVFVFN